MVKSLLNALMPLKEGQLIETVEYLPAELVPSIPEMKDSIVDVRCVDNYGRHFIVEMQMLWTPSFQSRVLFNASKAYVRQLDKGERYESLQPVYALNLLNDKYIKDSDEYYHHYSIVNIKDTEEKLDGLEFVFVELPKFKPLKPLEKRMAVLWLRFLTEIKDGTESVPQEFLKDENIVQALEILQESAFSKIELEYYDRVWDSISKERSLLYERTELALKEGLQKGMERGLQKGLEKGLERGMEKGRKEGRKEGRVEGMEKGREEGMEKGIEKGREEGIEKGLELTAINMINEGYSDVQTAKITNLSIEQIQKLRKANDH